MYLLIVFVVVFILVLGFFRAGSGAFVLCFSIVFRQHPTLPRKCDTSWLDSPGPESLSISGFLCCAFRVALVFFVSLFGFLGLKPLAILFSDLMGRVCPSFPEK